jgi:glycosyltransferase involved in cell wall biosynthesis
MRVAFDATPAVVCQGGLKRYVEMLWPEISKRVEVHAFALGRGNAQRYPLPLRRSGIPLRALHAAWLLVHWPRAETFSGPVDVVHATALVPPPTRRPLVVSVHDVMPLTHPQYFSRAATDMQRRQLAAAARAAVVLTDCNATANDIATMGVPSERIVVSPLGVFTAEGSGVAPSLRGGLPEGPFLLSVGLVTPRKGLEVLAAAATLLGSKCPPIVVVGPDDRHADTVRHQVRDADPRGRVRFVGPVDDGTLRWLYRNATAVCQATYAEGFGLPLLEAMAFGAPVVASDLPATSEVAAGCAMLVSPGDAHAFAEAVEALIDDAPLRNDISIRARARAAHFTWARTAEGVERAYQMALSRD